MATTDDKLHGLTVEEITLLSQEVSKAKANAYCPYSNFKVGATFLLNTTSSSSATSEAAAPASPRTISGANVENAAYPVGTCAERVALATAIAAGLRFGAFRALAVDGGAGAEVCSPCGMCRQFLREFCALSMPVFMFVGGRPTGEEQAGATGEYVVRTLEQLLPMSFGPENLIKHAAQVNASLTQPNVKEAVDS